MLHQIVHFFLFGVQGLLHRNCSVNMFCINLLCLLQTSFERVHLLREHFEVIVRDRVRSEGVVLRLGKRVVRLPGWQPTVMLKRLMAVVVLIWQEQGLDVASKLIQRFIAAQEGRRIPPVVNLIWYAVYQVLQVIVILRGM